MKGNNIWILVFAFFTLITAAACKRSHMCHCSMTGAVDTSYFKEYRGYSQKEARQLCKTDEEASNHSVTVECDIIR